MRKINYLLSILVFTNIVFSSCGVKSPKVNTQLTENEKKAEKYIINTLKPTIEHHSIEFGELKKFDIDELISEHKIPTIFGDFPLAFEDNEKAFDWLKSFSEEVAIAYSMTYTYGLRANKSDAWDSFWCIILFDNEYNVIEAINYAP